MSTTRLRVEANFNNSRFFLAGGNTILHYDNSTHTSLGQRVFQNASPITDLCVSNTFIAGYCGATDQVFTQPSTNVLWQRVTPAVNTNAYQFNDVSATTNAQTIMTIGWTGRWKTIVLSNEAKGTEVYQLDHNGMEDNCRFSEDLLMSSTYLAALTTVTNSFIGTDSIGINNVIGMDSGSAQTEPICTVPAITSCSSNCGSVCAVILTPEGTQICIPGTVTYEWSVTGGGTTWTSTDENTVFFPDANIAYTVCLTITDQTGSFSICEPLQYTCFLPPVIIASQDPSDFTEPYVEELSSELEVRKSESEYRIYPNPARDEITFERSTEGDFKCELLDTTGQKLVNHSMRSSSGSTILTGLDYPPGIYFLRITNEQTHHTTIERIILAK